MATPVSWIAAVQARFDTAELIALTNADAQTQAVSPSVDTTRLQAVIDDVLGMFSIESGFEPSLSDPSHVAAVCLGTRALLFTYKGQGDAGIPLRSEFFSAARKIRNIATAAPGTTNSGANALTPSEEAPGGAIVRPDADRANYTGYLPGNRRGASYRWGGGA